MGQVTAARARQVLKVTNSELENFRSCRQRWWFAYHELLRPRYTPRPLSTGDCIHAGLAGAYRHVMSAQVKDLPVSGAEAASVAAGSVKHRLDRYLVEMFERIESGREDAEAVVEESRTVSREASDSVRRFVERFVEDDARRYRVVAVEYPFSVRLVDAGGRARPRVRYAGVFDLVLYDPDLGDYVLGEHKSTASDATSAEGKLDMDPQTTGYVYALRQLVDSGALVAALLAPGQAAAGRVFYNVVRKTGPSEPKMNQDGTVSVAAIDTTQDRYRAALAAQGEPDWYRKDPKKQATRWRELQERQQTRLAQLPISDARYLCRHEAFHGPALVERWRAEALAEAGLLRGALRGQLAITRNPSQCNAPWSPRCPYRSVCIEDAPSLRSEFRVVDDPHVEVVQAESEQGGEA
jgi:hypothetical protein